jgi:predicted Zn finger-like uncharacterized protein
MKITCQTCQSKYTVSDEKVQGKTVKIKCRKCGATILVNSSGATTTAAGAADPVSISTSAGELGVSFLVNVAEGDQRTLSLVEVVEAYNSSVITADTYVWADGMGDWQPLGQVESIVSALNSGAAAAAPEPAAYAAPEPAPYAAAPFAAAAAPQPAAEPVHRPAARRDAGRRGPDLFGGGMATEEVATSAPAFNGRAPSPMASSGQREENSMLFSLSALTAKAAPSTSSSSSSSKSSGTKEDSGLIDLKALADSGGSSAQSNLVPDHAGLFPLGAPQLAAPLMTAPAPVASLPPPPASKTPIFIGVGIAVAALAIVGAFFAMKGGTPPPVVATESSAPVAAPTPPPVVEPPPTATVAAAAPTASASAAVASKTPVKSGGGKATTPAAGGAKAGDAACDGSDAAAEEELLRLRRRGSALRHEVLREVATSQLQLTVLVASLAAGVACTTMPSSGSATSIPLVTLPAADSAATLGSNASVASSAPSKPAPLAPIAWMSSERDARDRARLQSLPLLVYVRADWSVPCIELERRAWVDARVLAEARRFVPLRLDVTAAEGDSELYAQRYGVRGIPEIIVVDPSGRTLARSAGTPSVDELVNLLHGAAGE